MGYVSAVERISEFESCSEVTSTVKPALKKLHRDMNKCVRSLGGEKVMVSIWYLYFLRSHWYWSSVSIWCLNVFSDRDSCDHSHWALAGGLPVPLHDGPTLLLLHPHRSSLCCWWSVSSHSGFQPEVLIEPWSLLVLAAVWLVVCSHWSECAVQISVAAESTAVFSPAPAMYSWKIVLPVELILSIYWKYIYYIYLNIVHIVCLFMNKKFVIKNWLLIGFSVISHMTSHFLFAFFLRKLSRINNNFKKNCEFTFVEELLQKTELMNEFKV